MALIIIAGNLLPATVGESFISEVVTFSSEVTIEEIQPIRTSWGKLLKMVFPNRFIHPFKNPLETKVKTDLAPAHWIQFCNLEPVEAHSEIPPCSPLWGRLLRRNAKWSVHVFSKTPLDTKLKGFPGLSTSLPPPVPFPQILQGWLFSLCHSHNVTHWRRMSCCPFLKQLLRHVYDLTCFDVLCLVLHCRLFS